MALVGSALVLGFAYANYRKGIVLQDWIRPRVAGKPVLVSQRIPLADHVRQRGCGVVVEEVTVASLAAAIASLRNCYVELARNAMKVGPNAFSLASLVENHRRLYAP